MGLMNKLNKMKSFLFDEEEEEKEIKKVSKKNEKTEQNDVEVFKPEPRESIEELYFEDVSEETINVPKEVHSRVEKQEQNFSFPEFDDDDFMVASKKPEPIIPVKEEEPKRILYQGSKRKEETKRFKPSPIISPIYGLLDNDGNSVKEEAGIDKMSRNDEVTIDEVRKKAYGTLDDELEDTMKRLSTKTIEEAEKEMESEKQELSREKKKSHKVVEEKPIITSLEEDDDEDDDMILPNVNFKEIDVDKESNKSSKKVPAKEVESETDIDDEDDDDTKEQDLFNLIDTMYQNKEDEE